MGEKGKRKEKRPGFAHQAHNQTRDNIRREQKTRRDPVRNARGGRKVESQLGDDADHVTVPVGRCRSRLFVLLLPLAVLGEGGGTPFDG